MNRTFRMKSGPYEGERLELDEFDDHGEMRLIQPKNDCGYYWATYDEAIEVIIGTHIKL